MASKAVEEGNESEILRFWLVMCFQLIKEVQESVPDFKAIVYGLSNLGNLLEVQLRTEDDTEGKEEGKGFCSGLEVAYY